MRARNLEQGEKEKEQKNIRQQGDHLEWKNPQKNDRDDQKGTNGKSFLSAD